MLVFFMRALLEKMDNLMQIIIKSIQMLNQETQEVEICHEIPFKSFPKNSNGTPGYRVAGPDENGNLVWVVTTDQ